jgi:heterotetrameric sarcosine oxidase gamma subunit
MNSIAFKADTPMEQAGLENSWYETEEIEFRLLTSVTLLRLQSLLAAETLNVKLAETGIVLPGRVNQATGQDPSALCLAPRDWMIFSEYLKQDLILNHFQGRIDPAETSLIDMSSAYAVFRISGPAAPWLLSKLCGLDFRKGTKAGQHCTRTRLEQAGAILHYHQPGSGAVPHVFDVIIERSQARYFWQLLNSNLSHALELTKQHGSLHEQTQLYP